MIPIFSLNNIKTYTHAQYTPFPIAAVVPLEGCCPLLYVFSVGLYVRIFFF